MDDQELSELQDPQTWDDGADEVRPPVKSPRAVVSVAFPAEDFRRVAEQARRRGMKTSEFIRKAALDQLDPGDGSTAVRSVSGPVRTGHPPAINTGPKIDVRTPPVAAYATV
jgi:hypothetical protein